MTAKSMGCWKKIGIPDPVILATSKEHFAPGAPEVPNHDPEGRRGMALFKIIEFIFYFL